MPDRELEFWDGDGRPSEKLFGLGRRKLGRLLEPISAGYSKASRRGTDDR
jgi:hypothetical protein